LHRITEKYYAKDKKLKYRKTVQQSEQTNINSLNVWSLLFPQVSKSLTKYLWRNLRGTIEADC